MQLPTLSLLLIASAVYASPVAEIAARDDRGHYTVSGLGARKKAILNAGGNTLDLAIAMLETESMTTNYAYGKDYCYSDFPPLLFLPLLLIRLRLLRIRTNTCIGDNKRDDAANFGLFKQNWGMLRVCATRAGFAGQSTADWNNGAKLKYDPFPSRTLNDSSTSSPKSTTIPL
jgi:hypothetical protein